MATTTIPDLDQTTALNNSDEFVVRQGTQDKRVTGVSARDYFSKNLEASDVSTTIGGTTTDVDDYLVKANSSSFVFTSVADMVAGNSVGGWSVTYASGMRVSTGGTLWDINTNPAGGISVTGGLYAHPLTDICVLDYGVSSTGGLSDTEILAAVTAHQGQTLVFPAGEYNFSSVPAGIDGVEIKASSKQRLGWTDVALPTSKSIITGGKETALVACVIRWYDSTTTPAAPGADGWYTLYDAGENHDPTLMGPVSTSGTSALILDVNFQAYGLDENQWTPSGFVVGPDEGLADSGAIFGASVSSSQVTIRGTYNAERAGYIYYDGTTWQFSGNSYDNPSYSNGVLTLTRPTNNKKAGMNYNPSVVPTMRRQTAAEWGSNIVYAGLYALSGDDISIVFTDINGDRVLTPDTRLKFWLNDSGLRNPDFNFASGENMSGTNLWMVGIFVKRDGFE